MSADTKAELQRLRKEMKDAVRRHLGADDARSRRPAAPELDENGEPLPVPTLASAAAALRAGVANRRADRAARRGNGNGGGRGNGPR